MQNFATKQLTNATNLTRKKYKCICIYNVNAGIEHIDKKNAKQIKNREQKLT